jgi:hypothetical protein
MTAAAAYIHTYTYTHIHTHRRSWKNVGSSLRSNKLAYTYIWLCIYVHTYIHTYKYIGGSGPMLAAAICTYIHSYIHRRSWTSAGSNLRNKKPNMHRLWSRYVRMYYSYLCIHVWSILMSLYIFMYKCMKHTYVSIHIYVYRCGAYLCLYTYLCINVWSILMSLYVFMHKCMMNTYVFIRIYVLYSDRAGMLLFLIMRMHIDMYVCTRIYSVHVHLKKDIRIPSLSVFVYVFNDVYRYKQRIYIYIYIYTHTHTHENKHTLTHEIIYPWQ